MKNLIIVIHILLTVLLVGCADKGEYVGEKKDDKRHSKGTLTFYDGRKYVGEWKGEWKYGEFHGQGTLTFPDGSNYVGGWKDGKYHGQGTLTFPNGTKYVGEYKKGRKWNVITYDKDGNIKYRIVDGWKK
jgi:hypothetical protein